MTYDSVLISEGFAGFFGANKKQRGMVPVTSPALCYTKASTRRFGHIKGKGLAKQLCPDTSLLAEN